MKKRLFLSVGCANEFASDIPSIFAITVTTQLKERIKTLSEICTSVEALSIEDFNYEGMWSHAEIESSDITPCNIENVLQSIDENSANIEMPVLRVFKGEFQFTSIPKHCGDDMTISTSLVHVSELDNNEILLKI